MIDFNSDLYDPIYNWKGVAATITVAGNDVALLVIDETDGIAIPGNAIVETVVPACRVRMKELIDNNISTADLADGSISFNGNAWRIKSHRPMPNSNGESDGQVRLILLSEA